MTMREPGRDDHLRAAAQRIRNALRMCGYPDSDLRRRAVEAEVRAFWRAVDMARAAGGDDPAAGRGGEG